MRWMLALLVLFTLAACGGSPQAQAQAESEIRTSGQVDHLITTDQKVGDGAEAKPGMQVQVQYTGWLYDEGAKDKHGSQFDSSHDHGGQPFSFTLGRGDVISGWDQGVAGMHVGGKRILMIPAALGYGANGAGDAIPPNASLVFEVELVGIGNG